MLQAWTIYLRVVGIGFIILAAIATYRDLVHFDVVSFWLAATRLVVFPSIGIGLYLRNRWVVRLVYCLAIPTAHILWLGTIFFGPPLPPLEYLAFSALLCCLGILVFIPGELLTGYTPFKARGSAIRSEETDNPYQPPSSLR